MEENYENNFINNVFKKSIEIIIDNINNNININITLIDYIYQSIISTNLLILILSLETDFSINYDVSSDDINSSLISYIGILEYISNDELKLQIINESIYKAYCEIVNTYSTNKENQKIPS